MKRRAAFIFLLGVFLYSCAATTPMHPPTKYNRETNLALEVTNSLLKGGANYTFKDSEEFNIPDDASRMLWVEHVICEGVRRGYIVTFDQQNWVREFWCQRLFVANHALSEGEIKDFVAKNPPPSPPANPAQLDAARRHLLYGFTKEGVFYLHRSLVEEVGGGDPQGLYRVERLER